MDVNAFDEKPDNPGLLVRERPGVTQKLLDLQGCDGVTAVASPPGRGYARIDEGPFAGFFMAGDAAGESSRCGQKPGEEGE